MLKNFISRLFGKTIPATSKRKVTAEGIEDVWKIFDKQEFNRATSLLYDDILARQYDDARDKIENINHWGYVGVYVKIATRCCERAIKLSVVNQNSSISFRRMLALLNYAKACYSSEYDDVDGYGSATFNEIIGEILRYYGAEICDNHLFWGNLNSYEYYDCSTTLGKLLSLPVELQDFVDAFEVDNFQRCYQIVSQLSEHSRVDRNIRLALRLCLLIVVRIGDYVSAERYLDLIEQKAGKDGDKAEAFYDELVYGGAVFNENEMDNFTPYMRSKAWFYRGTYLKSIDDPQFAMAFNKCIEFNFDNIESVLANIEMGTGWEIFENNKTFYCNNAKILTLGKK
jgi:hypothetical protein